MQFFSFVVFLNLLLVNWVSCGSWKRFANSFDLCNRNGNYFEAGAFNSNNLPGTRYYQASAKYDKSLLIFGGRGYGSGVTPMSDLRDTWEFNTELETWRFKDRPGYEDSFSYHGTFDVFGSQNVPGGRQKHVAVTITNTTFLFGGYGRDEFYDSAYLCDLWEYDPVNMDYRVLGITGTTSVGPDGNCKLSPYNTAAHPDNHPSGRRSSTFVKVGAKAYLFGGEGWGDQGACGGDAVSLGDLWEFDLVTYQWRYIEANPIQRTCSFATGVAGETLRPENYPPSRYEHSMVHFNNKLYIWGGRMSSGNGYRNDMWLFDLGMEQWRWINHIGGAGGDVLRTTTPIHGNWGTANMFDGANYPSSRDFPTVGINDNTGVMTLYGGFGYDFYASQTVDYLCDIWEFDLAQEMWRWVPYIGDERELSGYGCVNNLANTDVYSTSNWPNAARGASKFYLFDNTGTDPFFLFFGGYTRSSINGCTGGATWGWLWAYDQRCPEGFRDSGGSWCCATNFGCDTCQETQPTTCNDCVSNTSPVFLFTGNQICCNPASLPVGCNECSNSYPDNECSNCGSGYFFDEQNEWCCDENVASDPNCISCDALDYCTVCEPGYFIDEAIHWCCPDYIYDTSGGDGACNRCSDPSASPVCEGCNSTHEFNAPDNYCCDLSTQSEGCQNCNVDGCTECDLTFYRLDDVNHRCCSNAIMPDGCDKCDEYHNCTGCEAGYTFDSYNSWCCPDNTLNNVPGCVSCDEFGNSCTGCVSGSFYDSINTRCCTNSFPECTECGSDLSTCIACNIGGSTDPFWVDSINNRCCTQNSDIQGCDQCDAISGDTCTGCQPTSYFYDPTNEKCCSNQIHSLDPSCIACEVSYDTCSNCSAGFFLDQNNHCCSDSLLIQTPNCESCNEANPDECQLCKSGYWLNQFNADCCLESALDPGDSNCLNCTLDGATCEACVNGYWLDDKDDCCHDSMRNTEPFCSRCDDQYKCTDCTAGHWFDGTQCCSDDILSYSPTGCSACFFGNRSRCEKCDETTHFYDDIDHKCCPNSIQNNNTGCSQCSSDFSTCTGCSSGLFLDVNNFCCARTVPGCSECEVETEDCLACQSGYQYSEDDGVCCSDSVYLDPYCTKCSEAAFDTCGACANGFLLLNKCCNITMLPPDPLTCSECGGDNNNQHVCVTCEVDKFLDINNNCCEDTLLDQVAGCNECNPNLISECAGCNTDEGYFFDDHNKYCCSDDLPEGCVGCDSADPATAVCNRCSEGYFYHTDDSNTLNHCCPPSLPGCIDCNEALTECNVCDSEQYVYNEVSLNCCDLDVVGAGCVECSTDNTVCKACDENYFVFDDKNEWCCPRILGDGCIGCNAEATECTRCENSDFKFNKETKKCESKALAVQEGTLYGIIFPVIGGLVIFVAVLLVVVICIAVLVRGRLKRLKKLEKIEDIDILLEESTLEEKEDIAKMKINKSLFELDYKELKVEKKLDEGAGGAVYFCDWKGVKVAFKCFKISSFSEEKFREFENELEILTSCNHPHLLDFYGAVLKEPRFAEHGNMKHFLQQYHNEEDKPYPLKEKLRMLKEVALGMQYLHSKNIIHRDLKLENVVVDTNYVCKVMDFGLSKVVVKEDDEKTIMVGTSLYMAPEMVLSGTFNYTNKVDVFSFAIMAYMTITENFRWYGDSHVGIEFKVAKENLRPKFSDDSKIKKWMKDLVKSCWEEDPSDRYSFDDVLEVLNKRMDEKLEEEEETETEKKADVETPEKKKEEKRDELTKQKQELAKQKAELEKKKQELMKKKEMLQKKKE